ncbi:monovalent cation:proton antiporter-2 (CPA2) family protein [Aliikangiella sp. IMCC44632]
MSTLLFFLIAVVIAVPVFRKIRLGAILGYLVAGLLMGPFGFDLIDDPKVVLHFSEIGVVLLLFVIGLELSPEKLWLMRRHIFGLGLAQLLICALVIGAGVILLIDASVNTGLVIGLALALSSTAFAIQLMAEKGMLASPVGRRGFAILLLQDLAVIPVLVLVQSFSVNQSSAQHPWWLGTIGVLGLLVIGRYAINPLLKMVSRYGSRESMTASSLLIVVGAAYLMEQAGLSMGMGAFIAGIMLANSSFRHQLETDIEPFKGLTLGLFFIAIGMTLDLASFMQYPLTILGLGLALMLAKCLIIAGLLRISGIQWQAGIQMGLMLSQGGEFAFVVMNLASDGGVLGAETANFVSLIVGVSMALTSPLVAIAGRVKPSTKVISEDAPVADLHENPEVMIAGFGRFGQTTGRILAANNIPFIALDKDAEHIEFVKQFGNKVHFGDASRLDVLKAAGIEKTKVILVATDSIEITEKITHLVVKHFPEIKVIARARNRAAYWALRSCGAHSVTREVFKSSLEAAASTLSLLGFSSGEALKTVDEFESHDLAMLEHSYAHRDDIDKLIDIGKKGRADLERLFEQDQS